MTRMRIACSSALLLLVSIASAQNVEQEPIVLEVTATGAPIVVDGKLDEEAWKTAPTFECKRENDVNLRGRVVRDGRDLVFGIRCFLAPHFAGIRLHVIDPATGRRVLVLLTPADRIRPPIALFVQRDRRSVPMSALPCEVRMNYAVEFGFDIEARVPLDALEIGRPAKDYRFEAQLWHAPARKVVSVFPRPGGGQRVLLRGKPDWGEGVEAIERPADPGLALITKLNSLGGPSGSLDMVARSTGTVNGRRNDTTLAEIEKQLREQLATYPEYVYFHFQLLRVQSARNRVDEAMETYERMLGLFPFVAEELPVVTQRIRFASAAGQFERALELQRKIKSMYRNPREYERGERSLRSLLDSHRAELRYREQDAKGEPLPRVRVETSRGAFVLELFENDAPNAVAQFLTLVERGFYNGTRFHWAAAMSQVIGGDPNSRDEDPVNDGFGTAGYAIESEPSRRLNLPGTIAFVPTRDERRQVSSSFAVNLAPNPGSDFDLTVFGRVIEGMDVIRALSYYDTLERATVLRKRSHGYEPVKRP
ncbi:MAG: peptidylprolyl isomerase [Planctomycetota bacterium]